MKKDSVFRKVDFILLGGIIAIALVLRLYKINTPLADLHSWRQADTAAVARNFVKDGFDLLHPRYDDLTSNQSGRENPSGLRYVEFPLYNAIAAAAYNAWPAQPLEVYGRLVSALFSLLIIVCLYYLGLKESGRTTAVAASLIYAIFPFFVFFSRTVLPETMAVALVLLAIALMRRWEDEEGWLVPAVLVILSVLAYATAILVKPTAVFYGLAIAFLFVRKYGFDVIRKLDFYLFFALSALPFLAWRYYISFHPEAIPASDWLITSVNTFEGQKNIFFKPAFFRWIFFERINNMILGGYLTFPVLMGIVAKPKRWLLHFVMMSGFVYLFVFQGGNVQHEYYQIILLPAIAIAAGLGISALFRNRKQLASTGLTAIIVVAVVLLSLFFSYYRVRDFYNTPGDLVQMANIIKTLTLPEDRIVTDRLGDTTLLYLADRRGAPSVYKPAEEMKKDGYKYLITANSDTIKQLEETGYSAIFENNQFSLFRL